MRIIETKPNESVSQAMIDEAKNLRNLARSIENGSVVAVGYAWIEMGNGQMKSGNTFCGDNASEHCLVAVERLCERMEKAIYKVVIK